MAAGSTCTNRMARAVLATAIVLGSLSFWTVLPIGWIRMTSAVEPGAQFVLVIVGCPLTMVAAFVLLTKTEAHRRRLSPGGEEDPRGGRGLLETALVGSAITALVALVIWWFFIADSANPSGPLQPV